MTTPIDPNTQPALRRGCSGPFMPPIENVPLNQIRYVDGTFTGGDGSEVAPFKTLQEAVNDLPVGGIMLIAPGTYAEALNIPAGANNYTFSAIGFEGLLQVFVTGLVTWNIVNDSQVSWSGIYLVSGATTGPIFSEANTGTGNARWNLFNCIQGVQTHDATARTHNIRIRAASLPVNGLDFREPASIPTQLMGFDVSGQVQIAGGILSGIGPFKCLLLRTRAGASIAAGVTIDIASPGSSFEDTGFSKGAPITINTGATPGIITLDPPSFYTWADTPVVKTGVSGLILADIYRALKDDGLSGATKTIDFSTFVNHKLLVDVNTTLTLISPGQSSDCKLQLAMALGTTIAFVPAIKSSGGLAPFVGNCLLKLWWTGTEWWGENLSNVT